MINTNLEISYIRTDREQNDDEFVCEIELMGECRFKWPEKLVLLRLSLFQHLQSAYIPIS